MWSIGGGGWLLSGKSITDLENVRIVLFVTNNNDEKSEMLPMLTYLSWSAK